MNTFKLFFVIVVVGGLLGCATGAKMEGMTFQGDKKTYPVALMANIDIDKVSGGQETNPAWTSEISDDAFLAALKESLMAQGLYNPDGKLMLEAQLLNVDQPAFGFDLTVTTHIRYTLVNSVNNSTLFEETVVTPHTATVKDAFVAVTRLRLANEGSAKKNIESFLEKISSLKINPGDIAM